MLEQLHLLELLQKQDMHLQEISKNLLNIPQQLNQAKRALQEMEKQLGKEQGILAENLAFQKKQAEEQKGLSQQITKTKSKLSQVQKLREMNAVQRELDTARRSLESREQELKQLDQALQEQQTKIANHEEKLKRYKEELLLQEQQSQSQIQKLQEKKAEEEAGRTQLLKQINPDLLQKYERIRKKVWPVLVHAPKGVCGGCQMSISPQSYNILQRGETFEMCNYCYRLLYVPKEDFVSR